MPRPFSRSGLAKKVAFLVVLLLCPCLFLLVKLLLHTWTFADIVEEHTVHERDLSLGYQIALNVSLKTVPCCKAAEWTPTALGRQQEQIPRIIHQTYVTEEVPKGDWSDAHQLCLNLHQKSAGWTHMFWTDDSARDFVAHSFPKLLATYDSYLYPIQRVDAMRYMILYVYGGIYIDLDIGCARSLESLLHLPAFFPRTTPTGVSNDLIGSRKQHPFFMELILNLQAQGGRRKFFTKYITVFFTTGPMFVNRVLASYWLAMQANESARDIDKVMILPPNFYSESFTAYFMHFPGSSWHGDDARSIILLLRLSWLLIPVSIMCLCYRYRVSLTHFIASRSSSSSTSDRRKRMMDKCEDGNFHNV